MLIMITLESDFDALLCSQNTKQWIESWDNIVGKVCRDQPIHQKPAVLDKLFSDLLVAPEENALLSTKYSMGRSNSISSIFSSNCSAYPEHDADTFLKQLPIRIQKSDYPAVSTVVKIPDDAFRKIKEGGKMMYQCTWKNCTSKFTRRAANCRAHWIRHNSFAPFVCEKCKLGFRRNADFKRHLHSCYSTNN